MCRARACLRGEHRLRPRKLLKRKARDLGDHIVDGGLKGGRRLERDVVGDHVQRVAARKLGRHLGNGEASGLGGQRGGATGARGGGAQRQAACGWARAQRRAPSPHEREASRSPDARVHLDDHHRAVHGVDRHLHIAAAALHTHLADDVHRRVAQALVLLHSGTDSGQSAGEGQWRSEGGTQPSAPPPRVLRGAAGGGARGRAPCP